MRSSSESVDNRMSQFFALANEIMGNQITRVIAGIHLSSLELAGKITFDQEERLKDNLRVANFLKKELIDYQAVCSDAVDILYHSAQVSWEEINLYLVVEKAIIAIKSHTLRDLSDIITIDIDKEQRVNCVYSLLFKLVSHLLIWIHLLAPNLPLSIDAKQVGSGITLNLSVPDLSASTQVNSVEEETSQFFKTSVEFILSILDGSFDWETNQLVPTKDKLIIYLPQKLSKKTD